MKRFYPEGFGKVMLRDDKLDQPLHWRKPSQVFVCSRADLFHPDVPFEFIDKVFTTMAICHNYRGIAPHSFMVLTKRIDRMLEYVTGKFRWDNVMRIAHRADYHPSADWPLPNVWLGVSIEDQKTADERIPLLLQCQAAVRFVSLEPCLGSVEIFPYLSRPAYFPDIDPGQEGVDGVILGGESGPGARPMHPDIPRSVRDQCQAAGVPFFFKQIGNWIDFQEATNPGRLSEHALKHGKIHTFEDGTEVIRVPKKAAGRLLDGRTWDELPEVLR